MTRSVQVASVLRRFNLCMGVEHIARFCRRSGDHQSLWLPRSPGRTTLWQLSGSACRGRPVTVSMSRDVVVILFVFLVVRPAGAAAQLQNAQHWLRSHARQILAAVVLLVGAYVVISGLARLSWAAPARDGITVMRRQGRRSRARTPDMPLTCRWRWSGRSVRRAVGCWRRPAVPGNERHPLQRVGIVVPQARRQGRLLTPSGGMRHAVARGAQ
jgi:hypothetical protein